MNGFLKISWQGTASFKSAYFIPGLVITTLQILGSLGILFGDLLSDRGFSFYMTAILNWSAMILALYWIIILIKCSDNVQWKGWGIIAGISFFPIITVPNMAAWLALYLN